MNRLARPFAAALAAVVVAASAAGAAALVVFASAHPAWAATLTVTTGADDVASPPAGGLREAVANAQPGDTIAIAKGVTVRLAGDLEIPAGKPLTIEGPAPAGLKLQEKIVQATPAPNPPARLVVKAGGTRIRQLVFVGVTVAIDHAGATVSTCEFDGKQTGKGITIDGSTGVSVGTADESNTFRNCTVAVESKDSAGVVVNNSKFTKNGTAVKSTGDTGVTVSENEIRDGNGVVFAGSSGTVEKNRIQPDKKTGTAIHAGPGPDAGSPSKGKVTGSGNAIKLKGAAKGIVIEGRTDVTVARNDVSGKTTGAGIVVDCGGAVAGPLDVCEIVENRVTGCANGIEFRDECANTTPCEMDGNTARRCPGAGFVIDLGLGASVNSATSTAALCGDGFVVHNDGGTVALADTTVTKPKRTGVDVGGTAPVDLGLLDVVRAGEFGVLVRAGAVAEIDGGTFTKAVVHVEEGGALYTHPTFVEDLFSLVPRAPTLDLFPAAFGTDGLELSIDSAGTLTVDLAGVPPGALVEVWGAGSDEKKASTFPSSGPVTLDVHEFAAGRFVVAVTAAGGAFTSSRLLAEGTVVWRGPPQGGGGANPFTFSKTKVILDAKVGKTVSSQLTVTNTSAVEQTIQVERLTGDFFNVPRDTVVFAPGETKTFTVGGSSMTAGTKRADIDFTSQAGKLLKRVSVTLKVTP